MANVETSRVLGRKAEESEESEDKDQAMCADAMILYQIVCTTAYIASYRSL